MVKEEVVNQKTYFSTRKTFYLSKLNIIALTIALIAIAIASFLLMNEYETSNELTVKLQADYDKPACRRFVCRKKYRIYNRKPDTSHLNNIIAVLDRLGYEPNNRSDEIDWDLLWAHDYPFGALRDDLRHLRPHQLINHFPGCGHIANKVDLATSGLDYVPVAFRLPADLDRLREHARRFPNKSFVQKHNEHRQIKVRAVDDRLFEDAGVGGTFVQEFVDRPLLIDGHKFDIGVYTIITSIDPLRAYVYNADALLRFCPEQYHPFDPENVDKYVVGDDYLPPWEVPSLSRSYKSLKFGMKQSLDAHLRRIGKEPEAIWHRIEDSLRVVLLAMEPKLIEAMANRFGTTSSGNFFEMMRFDYAIDEDLNVYLMEANMSPNLSSAHFPPNRRLFEQIVYNLFGLVGIGERIYKETNSFRSVDEELMVSADNNIAVYPEKCLSDLCRDDCVSPNCQLCHHCLTPQTRRQLFRAYREHINRGECKRLFPPAMTTLGDKPKSNVDMEMLSPENRLIYDWFYGKCLLDPSWCN